jgi:hypothetical protein
MQTKVLRSQLAQMLGSAMPPNGFTGTIPASAMMKVGALPPEVLEQSEYRIVATQEFPAANDAAYTVELPYYQEVYRSCGDNLVPLHRAVTLKGVEPIFVKGVTHGGMTEDKVVQGLIDDLLTGVRPVELERPTCSSVPTGVMEGISITAASSPANLHVYDAEGRHTGLRPDGTVELGIPGSVFDMRSGTQQVVLPQTKGQVRAVFEGLVGTDFHVRIVSGDGGTEKRLEYLAVPETATSNAEIKFTASNLGQDTELAVDKEKDGTFEEKLKPSSVTTFGSGKPVVVASADGRSGSMGSWPLIIGGAVAVAAVLGLGGAFLLRRKKA